VIDIVTLAEIIGALGVILGAVITVYKFYDNTKRQNEAQNEKIKKVQTEQKLICYALSACLDGLGQLGANHTVPKAKEMLDKHLNKAAHDE
jgi:hypothetical protein